MSGPTTVTTTESPLGIDPARVAPWLAGFAEPITGPLRFDRIGMGQSNLTYLVSGDGPARVVLRRPPLGELLASAHDVAREAKILAGLAGTAVPAPRIFGSTADPAITDAPLVAMEFVPGSVINTNEDARALSAAQRYEIGLAMADTLAAIHAVDIDEVGLGDLASRKPYAARQIKRWSGQWETSKTREHPLVAELAARFTARIPEQTETVLVHGDFHLRNVLLDAPNARVVAALDWELATLGDPIADIGSALTYWPEPDETQVPVFSATTVGGFPTRAALADRYFEATRRDRSALNFWHALGTWKVAIICEGIIRRNLNDPANRSDGAVPEPLHVNEMLEQANAIFPA